MERESRPDHSGNVQELTLGCMKTKGEVMKSFACGDVVPGCEARFVCSSDDDLLFAVAAHAATAHGLDDLSPALSQAVRAATVSTG